MDIFLIKKKCLILTPFAPCCKILKFKCNSNLLLYEPCECSKNERI